MRRLVGTRPLSDGGCLALALGAGAGAWSARPVPLVMGAGVCFVAVALRRPVLLVAGVVLLAAGLSHRSWAGLAAPAPAAVDAVATVVADPRPFGFGQRADLRLPDGRRVEAIASGPVASALAERAAGERVRIRGRLGPVPDDARPYVARRHVAARVRLSGLEVVDRGGPLSRFANDVRQVLLRGTGSLDRERRILFTGFVFGDDRGQAPEVTDDFRASGLSHLLAVSGSNVAFLLAVAAPLLRRLDLGGRLVLSIGVIVVFGTITRWEPSVTRASAMASVTLLAATLGRPASTLRVLALSVAGLLLVDPLLVGSVGFLLSVGACTGIALLSGRFTALIPGPAWFRMAAGVTVAAQAGVAPVLAPTFGGVPLASVPANLLAGPAAGPIMVWGVVAGLPAGLLGEPFAGWLHLPTRALLGWVAGVARWGAWLPLGELGTGHVALIGVGAVAAVLLRGRAPVGRRAAALLCAVTVLAPTAGYAAGGRRPLSGPLADGTGMRVWRSGDAVVAVHDGGRAADLLPALRAAGVRQIDLVVARRGSAAAARELGAVLSRVPARAVVAPTGHSLGGAVTVGPAAETLQAGAIAVVVRGAAPLEVAVEVPAPP